MNDDTISRQAAIANAISGRTREIDDEKWIRVSEVRESIKTLPSAERLKKQSSECKYCDNESNFCALYRPSAERRIKMVEETFVIYVNGTVIARDVPQYMLTDLFDAAVRHFAALPEMSIRVEHTKKED